MADCPVNLSGLTPIASMDGGDPTDETSLGRLADEARQFLGSKSWCKSVRRSYFGQWCEGIVGIFLFEIEPSHTRVDRWLWVIVGDLPPAYLVCDNSPDPPSALDGYIEEMRLWVEAVNVAPSKVNDAIPVNAPPTKEYANMLAIRLEFLEENVLPRFRAEWRELSPENDA